MAWRWTRVLSRSVQRREASALIPKYSNKTEFNSLEFPEDFRSEATVSWLGFRRRSGGDEGTRSSWACRKKSAKDFVLTAQRYSLSTLIFIIVEVWIQWLMNEVVVCVS